MQFSSIYVIWINKGNKSLFSSVYIFKRKNIKAINRSLVQYIVIWINKGNKSLFSSVYIFSRNNTGNKSKFSSVYIFRGKNTGNKLQLSSVHIFQQKNTGNTNNKQSIFSPQKRPNFLPACATCSVWPSNIGTMYLWKEQQQQFSSVYIF